MTQIGTPDMLLLSPGNGDRVFYETLLKQRPDSEMAREWCLSYGILEAKEAENIMKTANKKKIKVQADAIADTSKSASKRSRAEKDIIDEGSK